MTKDGDSHDPRISISELVFAGLFCIILIASVGDSIVDHVTASNVLAFALAPIGIIIMFIRRIQRILVRKRRVDIGLNAGRYRRILRVVPHLSAPVRPRQSDRNHHR